MSPKRIHLVIRLQNTSARERQVSVQVKPFRQKMKITLGKYGLATLAVKKGGKALRWRQVDLVERELRSRESPDCVADQK